ncbi:MAG: prepilin-type N-terminal cleavage/methylation domain-containing protein [Polyangiaceae bacterium]|nr:prepilin-type N-terminal cleavage/methylation domain-containing protein [Polyangiaceae bacterium]MCB9605238.1 prepilin-type N-terminal cleavage/methylation domain-containing protein [Polyangiaceae bacterium]
MKQRLDANRRGYTIVELMMAIAVFAIGVSGVIAMQKVTLASNRHAKNLAVANHIAQAWMERLSADAVHWNYPGPRNPSAASDLGTQTQWLKEVDNEADWFQPDYIGAEDFGPAFTALGAPFDNVTNPNTVAAYCTHIRLTWLNRDNQGAVGNGLIRAQVRVFWLREGNGGGLENAGFCNPATDAVEVGKHPELYHFVYQASAIRQEPAGR